MSYPPDISWGGWPFPRQPSQMATDVKKVGEIPGRARAAMHNGLLKKSPLVQMT